MAIMRKMIKLFLHINIICSLILLAVHVLDWYNPYMDFMSHASWVLYTLCVSTILLGIFTAFQPDGQKKKEAKMKTGRRSEWGGMRRNAVWMVRRREP